MLLFCLCRDEGLNVGNAKQKGRPAKTADPGPSQGTRDREDDSVREASEESFPASDPPAFGPTVGTRPGASGRRKNPGRG